MNSKMLIASIGVGLLVSSTASADESQPNTEPQTQSVSAALLEELIKVVNPTNNSGALILVLQQHLNQPGPEADQLAGNILTSIDQLEHQPRIRDCLHGLIEAKKDRLAAQLLLQIVNAEYWAGPYGNIVIGQLEVEDGKLKPERVTAQMRILEEGYFADYVKSFEQPLCFRAAGYRDLDLSLANHKGKVAFVGKVILKSLPAEESGVLKGKVVLDGSSDASIAKVRLQIVRGPLNTPREGDAWRSIYPKRIEVPVSKSGEFRVENLNPNEILIMADAEGHAQRLKSVKLKSAKTTDIGELRVVMRNLGFYLGAAASAAELRWESDFATAAKRAAAEGKPLMVMMTATWCGPCKQFEEETLNDPWIRSVLSHFVIVKAYEDKEVESKYGMTGYPTLVFADSSGKEIYRSEECKPALSFAGDCATAFQLLSIEQPDAIRILLERDVMTLVKDGSENEARP